MICSDCCEKSYNNESEVANLIQEVYLASDCRYGYRKIIAEIIASGVVVNHKKILRIMNKMKISGLYCRKNIIQVLKKKSIKYILIYSKI